MGYEDDLEYLTQCAFDGIGLMGFNENVEKEEKKEDENADS